MNRALLVSLVGIFAVGLSPVALAAPGDAAPEPKQVTGAKPVESQASISLGNKTEMKEPAAIAPETVVASIGDKKITYKMVSEKAQQHPALSAYRGLKTTPDPRLLSQINSMALYDLITRSLLRVEAEKNGAMTEAEAIKTVQERLKAAYPDRAKLDAQLASSGTTYDELSKSFVDEQIIGSYVQKVIVPSIKISDESIAQELAANPTRYKSQPQVKASHILIKSDGSTPESDEKAKKKIEELRAKATAPNADFAAIARENSECPSAAQGGDLGFFGRGMMVKPFEDAAFAAKIGAVSEPVKTQFGYHLIKVTETKAANPDDEKNMVRQTLERKLVSEAVTKKIAELRTANKVQISLPGYSEEFLKQQQM